MRLRILRGLQNGSLRPGDALPSTRQLGEELDADARVVGDAYRELAREGLVEVRPRSGIYVSPTLSPATATPGLTTPWIAEVLAQGIERGVPAPALGRLLGEALAGVRHRAAVITPTLDQTFGIRRELENDFGFETTAVLPDEIAPRDAVPRGIHRAHVLVTTGALEARVRERGARLGKPVVAVEMRPDLLTSEWQLLRGVRSYVLVADPKFGALAAQALQRAGDWSDVRVLVAGQDDLSEIGDEPVYATQAARERLGRTRLPAGVLPPARMLSPQTARELLALRLERGARQG